MSGIEAPASGSMELNGKVVAEQIGAQIFIDGWAMIAPGDPDLAVRLATARSGSPGATIAQPSMKIWAPICSASTLPFNSIEPLAGASNPLTRRR